MTRFLIFTALFPPLVPLIYLADDPMLLRVFPEIGFVLWLMVYSYVVSVIPAWLTALVDWALSGQPLVLRLVATMPVAAILGVGVARYLGQRDMDVIAALMGAIPAALCSGLSEMAARRAYASSSRGPRGRA